MSIKFLFVLGLLLVSAFAEEQTIEQERVSEPDREASAEEKAEKKKKVLLVFISYMNLNQTKKTL